MEPGAQEAPVATRTPEGRFAPGVSGNPAGRRVGTRNHIVELQEKLELAVRQSIKGERIVKIIDKLCAMAEDGNIKAAKLLLDKVISNASPNVEADTESGRTVVFKIVNATFGAPQQAEPAKPDAVDASFTVVASPTSVPQDQDGNQA